MATKKAPAKAAAKTKKSEISKTRASTLKLIQLAYYMTPSEREMRLREAKTIAESKLHLVQPSLALYDVEPKPMPEFVSLQGTPYPELYDEKKGTWKKFNFDDYSFHDMLEALTYVYYLGKLNSRTWIAEVFQTQHNWHRFLQELEEYEVCFRIRDVWWWTLARLVEHKDNEEGFSCAEDMAVELSDYAESTGQVTQLK